MNINKLNPRFHRLTVEEKNLMVPTLIKLFKEQKEPIKSHELLKKFEETRIKNHLWPNKVEPNRLRKLINWIRANQLLGIVADEKGYLATDNKQLLTEQIKRTEKRIASQLLQLKGTKAYLEKIKYEAELIEIIK
jgi:hypothetical protein